MINLFNEYKNSGKITETLLIGRNMLNKNPTNNEMFRAYMDFLLYLADKLPLLTDRRNFIGQANITLAFYEENADLSPIILKEIADYKVRIEAISCSIQILEDNQEHAAYENIKAQNNKQIKSLYTLKLQLENVKSQKEFDSVLQKISELDASIEHDYLTDEQKTHYDQLNKSCSECISTKMRELEHNKNVAYNKQAVVSYDSAFRQFKENEVKYKNQTQLFTLVSKTLFAYDASRLFNETLIYYNHVYSYIFSKLDDDGKFALTKFSIECERKLR